MSKPTLTHRLATRDDLPQISALMDAAIDQLLGAALSPEVLAASRLTMGLDTQLVDDGCYFLIFADDGQGVHLAGCGGWSQRATLFGGDDADAGLRDDSVLDPAKDPARLRAMYTHPDFTRLGVGRLIVDLAEDAARDAGFSRMALAGTVTGEPLYAACGYRVQTRVQQDTSAGVCVPLVHMIKDLTGNPTPAEVL